MSFVPGLVLCRRFHDEVIAPAVARGFPGLRYSAGRLDSGSELLGLDTVRSADHDWGPRVQIFVGPDDAYLAPRLVEAVDAALPDSFLGWPTRFARSATAGLGVVSVDGDRHGVTVAERGDWFRGALGFDPDAGVRVEDWLATPTQRLAEITGGAVFHDGLDGALARARTTLAWYPDDVWRYVLAAGWNRVAQSEHLPGRCAEVGDELGSLTVTAGLARDLMRLGLLLHRRWPPYGKWLGTVFARLPAATGAVTVLTEALRATSWQDRQVALCRALEIVAAWTNDCALAPAVDPSVRPFHGRPFLVLHAGRFTAALHHAITDPVLRARPPVGAVDQFVESTDVLTHAERVRAVADGLAARL